MKIDYGRVIVKQFDNLNDCIMSAREDLNEPIEWLEYLLTRSDYPDSEKAQKNLKNLKRIDGLLSLAKSRLDTFEKRARKAFEKRYKITLD